MKHANSGFLQLPRWRSALILLSALLLGSTIALVAQDKQQPKNQEADDVIKTNTNLVSFDVMVKDKKGKPITNLKADDFNVSENGVAQKIEFFDSTLTNNDSQKESASAPTEVQKEPARRAPRNVISLVMDAQTTEGANLKFVREGVTKYINESILDSDSVALFAITGGLQLLQPFTQDKQKLIAATERSFGVAAVSKTAERRDLEQSIATTRDQLAGAAAEEINTAAG